MKILIEKLSLYRKYKNSLSLIKLEKVKKLSIFSFVLFIFLFAYKRNKISD